MRREDVISGHVDQIGPKWLILRNVRGYCLSKIIIKGGLDCERM